jgi:hypothetical protein
MVTRETDWRNFYRLAMLELDPVKLPSRIEDARHAILDRIEVTITKPTTTENAQMNDALKYLDRIHEEWLDTEARRSELDYS